MYAPMALVNVNSITTGFGYNDLLLGQQFHIVNFFFCERCSILDIDMFSYVHDFFASELVGCHDLLMSNKTT
jgi:hypothetical protein